MKWNERLTLAREKKGLSKTDFWRLIRVSSATSTNWENGKVRSIKGENLVRVCQVLSVTEDWLLHGKEAEFGTGHCQDDKNIKAVVELMKDLKPEERLEIRAKIEGFVEGVRSVRRKIEHDKEGHPINFSKS